MMISELLEERAEKPGMFVGAHISEDSIKSLQDWTHRHGIDKPTPADKMHVTVLYSKDKQFDWESAEHNVEIDPSTYKLELFGEENNVLVLSFECPELNKRHEHGMDTHDLSWDFDGYTPHVTLSYEACDLSLTELPTPDVKLVVTNEYTETFDKDWA